MAQELPRTGLNRSGLVRALADLAVEDVPGSRQSFAERLGQWLDFNGALSLYSALNPGTAGAPELRSGAPAGTAIRAEYVRVRDALAAAMMVTDGPSGAATARIDLPHPAPQDAAAQLADFAPYHRYYLAQQREMGTAIAQLRANARAALAGAAPALRRLATLDAVMEQALAARERTLLASVPVFLGKRFEQLYATHQAARDASEADLPERWMQPGGWLAAFRTELQAVLHAELALRLQPVAGLIAAIDNEVTDEQ